MANRAFILPIHLNHEEQDHQELIRLMDAATKMQNLVNQGEAEIGAALEAIERIASFSPKILKSEWERVKAGERSFQIARKFVPIAITVSAVALILFVAS